MVNIIVAYLGGEFREIRKHFDVDALIKGYDKDFYITLFYDEVNNVYDLIDLYLKQTGYEQRLSLGWNVNLKTINEEPDPNKPYDLFLIPDQLTGMKAYRMQCYSESDIKFNFNPDVDIKGNIDIFFK